MFDGSQIERRALFSGFAMPYEAVHSTGKQPADCFYAVLALFSCYTLLLGRPVQSR